MALAPCKEGLSKFLSSSWVLAEASLHSSRAQTPSPCSGESSPAAPALGGSWVALQQVTPMAAAALDHVGLPAFSAGGECDLWRLAFCEGSIEDVLLGV